MVGPETHVDHRSPQQPLGCRYWLNPSITMARGTTIVFQAAMLCCIAAMGCGGSDGPKLVTVSGHVMSQGEPVVGISLVFHPAKGPVASAETDANGCFVLKTGARTGVVPGPQIVTATTLYESVHPETGAKSSLSSRTVPPRYSDPEQSPWKISVTAPVSDLALDLEP